MVTVETPSPLPHQWCAFKRINLLFKQGWNPKGTDVHIGQVSSSPFFSGFSHFAGGLHHGLYTEHRLQAPHQAGEHCGLWGVSLHWPVSHHHRGELTDCAALQDALLQSLCRGCYATSATQWNMGGGLDPGLHPNGVLQHIWWYWNVSLIFLKKQNKTNKHCVFTSTMKYEHPAILSSVHCHRSSWELPELREGRVKAISDSDGVSYPWYGNTTETVTLTGPTSKPSRLTVSMNDNFYPSVTWAVPISNSNTPMLTHITRDQSFITWLVAMNSVTKVGQKHSPAWHNNSSQCYPPTHPSLHSGIFLYI